MAEAIKTPIVPFSTDFGEYLRSKRVEQGFTQTDISDYLGYTSPQMVSKWERGLCGPRFTDLVKLQEYLNIDPNELLRELMKEQQKVFTRYLK